MKLPFVLGTTLMTSFFALPLQATEKSEAIHEEASHWYYIGEGAAHHWGDIDEAFAACKHGKKQSPINIGGAVNAELPVISTQYNAVPLQIINNGHTLHVNLEDSGHMMVGDKEYKLVQMHFHTPSEHYINGAPYPMEVHFVHVDAEGKLGVLGVMLKLGQHPHPALAKLWNHIPDETEDQPAHHVKFSATELLPEDMSYYSYSGSLTTPPCSEQVSWHVLKTPLEISHGQLAAFQMLFPINARPIQPLNDRVIHSN